MPHLTIEHSANLGSRVDLAGLVRQLHEAVLETGIFPEKGLRTRVALRDEYRIADGDVGNAFLHLVLRIGSGREEVALKRAGDGIFAALCEATATDQSQNPLALSFEIQEIDPNLTWKQNNLAEWMARRSRESG
jgi:5-carboxymethyl-2-hydroxymuconate isomerase